jgi:RNA polymerase sigma-70 factor, ECF subfamily
VTERRAGSSVVSLPSRFDVDAQRLCAGLLAEEPWAQAAVFDQYAPQVRRVLRRVLGPGAHIDDAQQDVFIGFFRSVRNLEDPTALRSFLIGISVRVGASELRRRRMRSWLMLSPEGDVPDKVDPGADTVARAALRRLYDILDDLEITSRMVFVLRHIEELSLPEVAAAMDISLATSKRKLAKADAIVLSRVERDPDLMHYTTHLSTTSTTESLVSPQREDQPLRGVRR